MGKNRPVLKADPSPDGGGHFRSSIGIIIKSAPKVSHKCGPKPFLSPPPPHLSFLSLSPFSHPISTYLFRPLPPSLRQGPPFQF